MTDTHDAPDRHDSEDKPTRDLPVVGGAIIFVFCWIMIGFSVIYGVRLYYNDPIHPTFIPIAGGVFAATMSFAIVMTLRHVAGEVDFKFGATEYKGSTGPIIMWCLCFLCIVFGLNLMGVADAVSVEYKEVKVRPLVPQLLGRSGE